MADSSSMPARPSKRASSSKKVASGARSGRKVRAVRERPRLGFPIAIVAICIIGTLVVVFSRGERVSAIEGAAPPKTGDHWHIAYGIYVCDSFLPPLTDNGEDKTGLHTHGDGLMHVHPFGSGSAGYNARVGVWADTVGLKLTNDGFTLPDGTSYSNGSFQCDGEPANVYLIRWSNALDSEVPGEVFTSGFRDVRYKDDGSAIVLAVVPESKVNQVPRPPSEVLAELQNPSDVEPGTSGAATTDSLPTDLSSLPTDLSTVPTDLSTPSTVATDSTLSTDATVATDSTAAPGQG